jgi:hypothetical protein
METIMKTIIALYYKIRFALYDRFPGRVRPFGARAMLRAHKLHKVGENKWRVGNAKTGPIIELLPRRGFLSAPHEAGPVIELLPRRATGPAQRSSSIK